MGKSPTLVFLLTLFVAGMTIFSTLKMNQNRRKLDIIIPRNQSVSMYLNGGYGSFFSSIAWVGGVFEYSKVLFDGESPSQLDFYFGSACDLDTNWAYPRLLASWILIDTRGISPTSAIPYLQDGAKRFPKMWKFRITWAQGVMDIMKDSVLARDSAAKILLPLANMDSVPEYTRNLAFTLLHKNGKPDQAMDILLQTYEQVPDPLIRFQFQNKIADLLQRNDVKLGSSDSAAFLQAIAGMLDSKDTSQIGMAKQLLVRLVQPEHKEFALADARQLAQQFKAYQQAAVPGR